MANCFNPGPPIYHCDTPHIMISSLSCTHSCCCYDMVLYLAKSATIGTFSGFDVAILCVCNIQYHYYGCTVTGSSMPLLGVFDVLFHLVPVSTGLCSPAMRVNSKWH